MRINPETRRRSILPLLAVALGAVYLFVLIPLDRKIQSADAPLESSWRKLVGALGHSNAPKLDFTYITNQFDETRVAVDAFNAARDQARARIELTESLRFQLNEPFQLVDYETEAVRLMGTLARMAREQKVALEPAVLSGFPAQTADMSEPSLLWAELAFVDSLLTTAINSKVTTIHSIAAPSPLTNAPPENHARSLTELPVQIELTGRMANVGQFLQALPLRAAEIKAAGLPDAPTNKPALFIDRVVLRKQSPDKPDEVRLSLRAVGFVFRE